MINDLHHHKGQVRSLKFTMDTLVTGSGVSAIGAELLQLHFEALHWGCTTKAIRSGLR